MKPAKRILNILFLLAVLAVVFTAFCLLRTDRKYSAEDPQLTASRFMDALCAGHFEEAYACMYDNAGLGLETVPESPAGKLLCQAFYQNLSYTMDTAPSRSGRRAVQSVCLTAPDLGKLTEGLDAEVQALLEQWLLEASNANEIYDDTLNYRPEVTEEAFLQVLGLRLERMEDYMSQTVLQLELEYDGSQWRVLDNEALFAVLSGHGAEGTEVQHGNT